MQVLQVLATGLACGLIIGCSPETADKKAGQPAATGSSVVQSNARFAADLYAKLRTEEGNIFFSPYSISSALAMTGSGARGKTAREMSTVLGFDVEDRSVHAAFGKLTGSLNERGRTGAFDLAVAKALWGQKGYAFLDSFLTLNRECYGAGLSNVDFVGDTEGARLTINAWTEKATHDRIKDLLGPGVLNADTKMVLTNAIYFKGAWAEQFDEQMTGGADFYIDEQRHRLVAMMRQTGHHLGYGHARTFAVLELPYQGDALSMLVFLPRDRGGLAALEDSLNSARLSKWATEKYPRGEVHVALPKFTMTARFDLCGQLTALGMKSAFLDKADFSGIDGTKKLYLSALIHRAFVEVSEEGTEAAAATGAFMQLACTLSFRADHPFLFLIRDNASGSILFMGRVVDPQPSSP